MTTTYLQRMRLIRRDAWLAMTAQLSFGFSQRGAFAVLFNLYLLRLGYEARFIGLVNAVWLLTFAILAVPGGLLIRRWGARRLILWGKVLEGIGLVLAALADLLPGPWRAAWLLGAYALAGIGGAGWTPAYAPYLMGITQPQERDHAFALSAIAPILAGLLGSLVGGLLPGLFASLLGLTLDDPAPYRWALLLSAVTNFGAALALLRAQEGQVIRAAQGPVARSRFPWAVIAVMAGSYLLFATAYGPILTFMNLYLDAQLQTPTAMVGSILAAARLFSLPAGLAAPLLVARWGRLRANTLGLGILAIGLALLLFTPHWLAVGAAYTIALAAYMLTSSVGQVYGQELVSAEWRGAMAGANNLALGLGLGSVALGGGYLISAWGYPALFALAGAASLGGALVFWGYFRRPRGELAQRTAP